VEARLRWPSMDFQGDRRTRCGRGYRGVVPAVRVCMWRSYSKAAGTALATVLFIWVGLVSDAGLALRTASLVISAPALFLLVDFICTGDVGPHFDRSPHTRALSHDGPTQLTTSTTAEARLGSARSCPGLWASTSVRTRITFELCGDQWVGAKARCSRRGRSSRCRTFVG
jgi:hypothetical protein